MSFRGAACVLLLMATRPGVAASQDALDRWMEDFVPRRAWGEEWSETHPGLDGATPAIADTSNGGYRLSWEAHSVGLGPYSLREQVGVLAVVRPLGPPGLSLDLSGYQRLGSRLSVGPGSLGTDVPWSVTGGLSWSGSGTWGRGAIRVGGTWQDGPGWSATVRHASSFHRLQVHHGSRVDGGLELDFSEVDVLGGSDTESTTTEVVAGLRWPRGRLHDSELSLAWTLEEFDPRAHPGAIGLRSVIAGSREQVEVGVQLRVATRVRLVAFGDRSGIDSDGSLEQNEQRAGRLFFGTVDTERLGLGARWERIDDGEWRLDGTVGSADGALSARLETWPFREVWEQVGAVAYRVRGTGGNEWTSMVLSRRSSEGAGWSLGLTHMALSLDGEDWLVTAFGFGRSDEHELVGLEADVLLAAGELRGALPWFDGRLTGRLHGSLPVHATWNAAVDEALEETRGVGGWDDWLVVTVGLAWSY